MMHKMHDLGMNLRRIREARKLNQRQLAELVGVDQATIQRAETMHPSAKLATYRMCAQALGISLAELFSEDRTAAEETLIAAFRASDDRIQRMMLALVAEAAAQEPPHEPTTN